MGSSRAALLAVASFCLLVTLLVKQATVREWASNNLNQYLSQSTRSSSSSAKLDSPSRGSKDEDGDTEGLHDSVKDEEDLKSVRQTLPHKTPYVPTRSTNDTALPGDKSLPSLMNLFSVDRLNRTESARMTDPRLTHHGWEDPLSGEKRIVGGTLASAGAYPTYAFTAGSQLCGSTLIWYDVLLTAAHCDGAFLDGVLLGGLRMDGQDGRYIPVNTEFPHPEYSFATDANDIMLIGLNQSVQDVPLQALNFDDSIPPDGEELTVIGLGYTAEGGPFADELLEVRVNVVDQDICNGHYGKITEEIMLCAGIPEGGKDSCQGDSGGPLLNDREFQVGVVSFGEGCARPNTPAVYARVSAYEKYINDGICRLSSNPPNRCKTDTPTIAPGSESTSVPDATIAPTTAPTPAEANDTTNTPTTSPVDGATSLPTGYPTVAPAVSPESSSTEAPTLVPAEAPTLVPTEAPVESSKTQAPSLSPILGTSQPVLISPKTNPPSSAPLKAPTDMPIKRPPTQMPVANPPPLVLGHAGIPTYLNPVSIPTPLPTIIPTAIDRFVIPPSVFSPSPPTSLLNRLRTAPPFSVDPLPSPPSINSEPRPFNFSFFRPRGTSNDNNNQGQTSSRPMNNAKQRKKGKKMKGKKDKKKKGKKKKMR